VTANPPVLILGIGNILMGDEGVGVRVVSELQKLNLPPGVECLDGGTGGFQLLGPMQDAGRVVLVDATADGSTLGTVHRVRPRFSKDYPRTLTAHDIGLKDLLDAFYLLGDSPDVTLFAVSISIPEGVQVDLSEELTRCVPGIVERVLEEVGGRLDDNATAALV
jgi:hydrogenase maturation protease